LFGEEITEHGEGADPQKRSQKVEQQEPRQAHADHAGQRGGDGAKPGQKLGDQQRPGTVAGKEPLGLADAGVGFQGNAAEHRQQLTAAASSQVVPEKVARQGGADSQAYAKTQLQLAQPGQGSHGNQQGGARYGKPRRFREDPDEHHHVAMLYQKRYEIMHAFPFL